MLLSVPLLSRTREAFRHIPDRNLAVKHNYVDVVGWIYCFANSK